MIVKNMGKYFKLICIVMLITGCSNRDYSVDEFGKVKQRELIPINEQRSNIGGYSSVDFLLRPGIAGYYMTYDKSGGTQHIVVLNDVIIGEQALHIITKYCESGESPHDYEEPEDGCTWHLAVFTVSDSPKEFYTDCKIRGLDGNNLEYNNVVYSSRGYDILNQYTEDENGYHNLMVYYAVPNGCNEYILEFGDRNIYKDIETTAFYYVNISTKNKGY